MQKTKKPQLFKIVAPKVKVTTKGYINLISKSKTECDRTGKPIKFRSKKALKRHLFAKPIKQTFIKVFSKAGVLESNILDAKENIKKALRSFKNSFHMANLFIELAKAKLHLRSFKYSLPRTIRFNLF